MTILQIFMNTGPRIALGILLLPALLSAQRGMAGPGGFGKTSHIARDAGIVIPRQLNTVNLLIEHRQELTLSDSQFKAIVAVKRGLDSLNAPLNRRLDSLQRLFKGGSILFGASSPEHRDSISTARAVMGETQAELRENISVWRDKAYLVLSSTQAAKAGEIEDKAQRAIAEESKGRGPGG
jgi:hypothetical protein